MRNLLVFLLALSGLAFGQGVASTPLTAFQTLNGQTRPLANATITVCAANTSGMPCSPALVGAIFKDTALTQPLSNPFTADANGNYQFSAAPGQYTVTITAANYSGFSYQWTASLSGGSGSAILTTNNTFSGTNAFNNSISIGGGITGSTAISGPRPWIDVTAPTYGADPTGVADSTGAIQAAFNNCVTNTQPGKVFIPSGTYLVGLLTMNNGCTITTDALQPAHFIRNPTSSNSATNLQIGWISIASSNVSFQGIELDANTQNSVTGNGVILLGSISNVKLKDLYIHNVDGTAVSITATSSGGVGPSGVEIFGNRISTSDTNSHSQGAIYGEDNLTDINIHDNSLLDGTGCHSCSTVNFLSAGKTSIFNNIVIDKNKILAPGAVMNGSGWGIQMGGFNAFGVTASRVTNNDIELTNTSAGFISIPIAIAGKIISHNHMNTHYFDFMRCGATTVSACVNDGVSNSTSTWTSAGGSFTSSDTGRTLKYTCGGTNYSTLVTFSNSTTLTLSTAAVCTGSSEPWYLMGYSATGYGIEGGGSTGTVIAENVEYFGGSQNGTGIGLDGTSYATVSKNQIFGIPETSGVGISFVAGTNPQAINTLSQNGNVVNLATSGALNATWQPSTTIAITSCGTGLNTCRTGTDAVYNNSTTLSSATAAFTQADVNRVVNLYGCGAVGVLTINQIVSVTNGTTATLANTCTQNTNGNTWQIVTSNNLFITTILNLGYSRTSGTFSFVDATTGVSCASNCGGMIQTVSFNNLEGNIVEGNPFPGSGNTFAFLAHTQSANIEYAVNNTFANNTAIWPGGAAGGLGAGFGITGANGVMDGTIFNQNHCVSTPTCLNRSGGTNTQFRDTDMRGNIGTALGGTEQPGEVYDAVAPITVSQLSGTGFGTSPTVNPNSFSCATCITTTRGLWIKIGTAPAASTGVISNLNPPAKNGWSCSNLTDQTRSGIAIRESASTTTSITLTFDNAATAADIITGSCSPN